jgi:hypothetical protein
MRRSRLACVGLAFALACASTHLTSTWRDPGVGAVQFRKVAGLALSQDATLRRVAEDAFVKSVGPRYAVAAYALIPDDEIRDKDKVRARLEAAGVDGAALFRLVGVDERKTWVPPTSYGGFGAYYGWAAPMAYQPGYLATDRVVQVETTLYSVAQARLVWAARSETLNPKTAQETIDGVVSAVVAAMRKDQLIP